MIYIYSSSCEIWRVNIPRFRNLQENTIFQSFNYRFSQCDLLGFSMIIIIFFLVWQVSRFFFLSEIPSGLRTSPPSSVREALTPTVSRQVSVEEAIRGSGTRGANERLLDADPREPSHLWCRIGVGPSEKRVFSYREPRFHASRVHTRLTRILTIGHDSIFYVLHKKN